MTPELYELSLVPSDELPVLTAEGLLAYPIQGNAALASCRQTILKRTYDRDHLAGTLAAYNREIGNDKSALANVERLREPQATVIVTGQQAGMFTGPLYTIYKAATTITLAAAQSRALGAPVIPVFWNATEDHDHSEIASFYHPGREWRAEFHAEGVAAERLSTEPACTELIETYLQSTKELYREEIHELLRCEHADYGRHSSAVLARLFRGAGLVLLEPRLLRGQSREFFQDCVRRREEIRAALQEGAEPLTKLGLTPEFQPGKGFGLFHINAGGVRRQILEEPAGFLVSGEYLTEAELLARVESAPESFSTGAYLRPVLQSLRLPNMAFVAGPGELRYHLQLRPLYELFGAEMPALRRRNQATILGPAEQRIAGKLGLTTADYFKGPGALHKPPEPPPAINQTFDAAAAQLAETGELLREKAGELTGEQAIATFLRKAQEELSKVRKRAGKEHQRRHEVDNARIDRFFQAVYPGGPQERRLNVFYFIQYRGPELIRDVLECLDPEESRHYVLRID